MTRFDRKLVLDTDAGSRQCEVRVALLQPFWVPTDSRVTLLASVPYSLSMKQNVRWLKHWVAAGFAKVIVPDGIAAVIKPVKTYHLGVQY